jgi:hypothetical protein
MKRFKIFSLVPVQRIIWIILAALLLITNNASAHCDTIDGLVVKAAQKSLETGNINHVLIWVQKKDEDEIKKAFEKTLKVRSLTPEAKEFADMYFFETLVRIHRASEGAPYTGLKPAGLALEPGAAEADFAVEKGSIAELIKKINSLSKEELMKRFKHVLHTKNYSEGSFGKESDIEAGREFVKHYVTFLHYVEGIFMSLVKLPEEHLQKSESHEHH